LIFGLKGLQSTPGKKGKEKKVKEEEFYHGPPKSPRKLRGDENEGALTLEGCVGPGKTERRIVTGEGEPFLGAGWRVEEKKPEGRRCEVSRGEKVASAAWHSRFFPSNDYKEEKKRGRKRTCS